VESPAARLGPAGALAPAAPERPGALPDLVCLAEVAWGYFRTRKQFLFSRLARRWRVVYFEPLAFGRGNRWRAREEDGVTVVTVPFPKPGTSVPLYNALLESALGRALVERLAGAVLRLWLRRLGVSRPVCVVSNVYAANLLGALRPRLVCYDFNDHPLQFPTAPRWTERYFRRLLECSDLVLAVSDAYRNELAALTRAPVITLENGVEFERFAGPQGGVLPSLAELPRPRLGYLGRLSHFLDVPLLERLADRGIGTLALAGPLPAEMRQPLDRLLSRSNVRYLGELPYAEVPRFLAGLDLGLIPFRAGDRFTTGINPNKLYQYLAAGLPVVSSPIAGQKDDPAGLYFAADGEGFVDAVRRALAGPPDHERLRQRARAHDWDTIAEDMDRLLREHLQRREAIRGSSPAGDGGKA
jgi:glycosyltransferase involved in cell wall biosynthesis